MERTPPPPEDGLKIGEAAARLGLAPSALRFYEDQGLIAPYRSAAGTRRYTEADVERLAVVQALARVGVPLDRARALAAARPQSPTGDAASHRVHDLLDDLRTAVEARRRECEALLDQIDTAAARVTACYGCDRPPTREGCHDCPVAPDLADLRLMRLVWQDSA